MATVEKHEGKNGISYRITVYAGFDSQGKRIRHRKTWKPEPGMTARQMEKAAQRAAADFEQSIERGYVADNRQTFSEYAQYVIDLKARTGAKHPWKGTSSFLYEPIRPSGIWCYRISVPSI